MSERHGTASGEAATATAAKRPAARPTQAPRRHLPPPPRRRPLPASACGRRARTGCLVRRRIRRAARRAPAAHRALDPVHSALHPAVRPRACEPQAQDRGLRRAIFLAELAEAKELRRRVAPRRARAAELHARLLRTFRY